MEYDMKQAFPFLKLQIILKGKLEYTPSSDKGISISLNSGQYNFFYLPVIEGKLLLDSGDVNSIDIEFDEGFIRRLFKNDFNKVSGIFGEAIQSKVPFKMWDTAADLDPFLKSKIEEILINSKKDKIDLFDFETILQAFFRYLFLKINKVEDNLAVILKKEDRDKIDQAEKILRTNLKDSITVDKLAITIGVNRDKLNRNFKKVYKEPVFAYLTRLRMHKAKVLLSQNQHNISEVAYSVGYKNPQHFTVAFKKFYGHLPSK